MKTEFGFVVALGGTLTAASFTPKDRLPLSHHQTEYREHSKLEIGRLSDVIDVYSGA